MKNKYLKKWKKTHRQRRKKREKIINIEFNPDTMLKLITYCKKHKVSRNTAIKRAIRKAMLEYGWNNEGK